MWGIDENGGLKYLPPLTSNELSMIKFFHCFVYTLCIIALQVVKGRWRNLFVIITKPNNVYSMVLNLIEKLVW